jgi:sugar phosphate isomerase/epimerase
MDQDMLLGCFNRPWAQCELDRALAGIRGAGFRYCGFLRHHGEPIVSASQSDGEANALLHRVEQHGLKPLCNMVALSLTEPLEVSLPLLEAEIDRARQAGIPHLMTGGTSDATRYDAFFALVKAAAPCAAAQGVTLGLKHHGGISGTNRDCLDVVERVDSSGFGIWYDPGNIIHYTGTSPEADLAALLPHIVGMCVKDCTGGLRGSVTITPGDGEVDFPRVFQILRSGGFDGPALVECLGGASPEEVDAEARRVHDRLLRWQESS